jgi:hypothetical protein
LFMDVVADQWMRACYRNTAAPRAAAHRREPNSTDSRACALEVIGVW